MKEVGGVRFRARNLAQSAELTEKHKLPDVEDGWRVAVFGGVRISVFKAS